MGGRPENCRQWRWNFWFSTLPLMSLLVGKVNFYLTLISSATTLPHFPFILGFDPDEYNSYPDKGLTNVFRTVNAFSTFQCTTWCSMTDGWMAVNVIGNHDMTCELTMEDAHDSELLVLGKVFEQLLILSCFR